jgi:hypothetical protein
MSTGLHLWLGESDTPIGVEAAKPATWTASQSRDKILRMVWLGSPRELDGVLQDRAIDI